jgi:L-lactate utilization protein LutC
VNRESFLARVRQAAEAGKRYRVPVEPAPPNAGYVGASGDVCDALAAEVQQVGGDSLVVNDWPAAREALTRLLRHYQVRSALCWEHPVLERLELSPLLAQLQIANHGHLDLAAVPEDARRAIILGADVGISSADFAVAETGTLAVCARPGQERLTSLVPPVHIALVAADQILPDLFDLFREWSSGDRNQPLPSNLVLISGPSKTGDIELELTTGVHGPGKWHVIVVRERMSDR